MNHKLYDDDDNEDVNNLKLKKYNEECTNAPLKSAEKLSPISDAPPGDVILRELNQCTNAYIAYKISKLCTHIYTNSKERHLKWDTCLFAQRLGGRSVTLILVI